MKRGLIEVLACPVCKGDLKLGVNKEEEQEIITGTLYCPRCDRRYPIEDGIPNLLPPEQGC